jgi:drug/metabolite transporter (DMT)-like permease
MNLLPYILLSVGVLCAAAGQIAFKLGATGRTAPLEFVNIWIVGGLGLYGVGTLLWIWCLSRLPLTVVYPFTALTFVIVYVAGLLAFHEPVSLRALAGVGLVLGGLYLILSAP